MTLVELMVVTVIISITASMLYVGLFRAKEKVRQIICMNNLRQIGLAVELYAVENSGWLPGVNADDFSAKIYVTLKKYANNPDTFWCPKSGENHKWNGLPPATFQALSYGFNWRGTDFRYDFTSTPNYVEQMGMFPQFGKGFWHNGVWWQKDLKNIEWLKAPSRLIAAAENPFYYYQPQSVSLNPALPQENPDPVHNGGCNVLFADGHIQWMPISALISPDPEVYKLWNYNNEDHRYINGF